MKKNFVYIFFLLILFVVLTSSIKKTMKSSGPPSCNSGEPPNKSNCTSCHEGNLVNTGNAIISLDLGGADTLYSPDHEYTITVNISKGGMKRAGFQIIALQDNNNKLSPGTFVLTDTKRTQLLNKKNPHPGSCTDEERSWIEHMYPGINCDSLGNNKWSFKWTSPPAGVGSITFYLATLEANNDLTEFGDFTYTVSKTIKGWPLGIQPINPENKYAIYPQPSHNSFFIAYQNDAPDEINIYQPSGEKIKSYIKSGLTPFESIIEIQTKGLSPGIYFIEIKDSKSNRISVKKVVIL